MMYPKRVLVELGYGVDVFLLRLLIFVMFNFCY